MRLGEVWFVDFPFEENSLKSKKRPVVILDVENIKVLSVKVTSKSSRGNDEYDYPIVYWEYAKLRFESTARIAKTIKVNKSDFVYKIGDLHEDDLNMIQTKYMEYILNS